MQYYPIDNIMGIEIDPFAVDIAKATLWMMHALESRRHGLAEPVLPLPTLKNLIREDSLKIAWPETDVVIGNPPFHGDRKLRGVRGDEYLDWLKQEFNVGIKDHCVYFFLRAHENLKPGCRAGLVATKTISETKNRDASLAKIVQQGGVITDAISRRDWSGEAAVDVSIVCWTKTPPSPSTFILDGKSVTGITTSLKPGTRNRDVRTLPRNSNICYTGYYTRGMGFVITPAEAESVLARGGETYRSVVAPFINGDDTVKTVDQSPTRWVIDLADLPLDAAERNFPLALAILRERVLPERREKPELMERWWQFWMTRKGLRKATESLGRFAVAGRVGKRLILVWAAPHWRPSDACNVFAFEDDYSFGVCTSTIHEKWARATSSTLEDRLRYNPSNAFETFPFPSPNDAQRVRIAAASRSVVTLRRVACEESGKGLTKVYNMMDEGGFRELKSAHEELDVAVMDAYGLDADLLNQPERLLDALFDLNEKAATDPNYRPFGERENNLLDEES